MNCSAIAGLVASVLSMYLSWQVRCFFELRENKRPPPKISKSMRKYNPLLNMSKRINLQDFVLAHVEHRLYWNRYWIGITKVGKHHTHTIGFICSCPGIFTRTMKLWHMYPVQTFLHTCKMYICTACVWYNFGKETIQTFSIYLLQVLVFHFTWVL